MQNIPKEWKYKLKQICLNDQALVENDAGSIWRHWTSRVLYRKIINKIFPTRATEKSLWAHELGIEIEEEEWERHYYQLGKIMKSTKLRYFQYQLSNKKLVTNYMRNKWDEEINPMCYYCKTYLETTWHLMSVATP